MNRKNAFMCLRNSKKLASSNSVRYQENFLLKSNGYFAKKALPEHHIIFKPATKDVMDGRRKNGLFIAVPIF